MRLVGFVKLLPLPSQSGEGVLFRPSFAKATDGYAGLVAALQRASRRRSILPFCVTPRNATTLECGLGRNQMESDQNLYEISRPAPLMVCGH
jgi:hypothetical protein